MAGFAGEYLVSAADSDLDDVPGVRIEDNMPASFRPTQVIYRELNFTGGSHYTYHDHPWPIPQGWPGIEAHARNIINNGYTKQKDDYEEDEPLSIPVRADSYIILSTRGNQIFPYFSATGPGVTLAGSTHDEPPAADIFGKLRHYDPRGAGAFTAAPCANCQFVYFSAAVNEIEDYVQKLYFNVLELQRMGRTVPHSIDPDIRYPGNGGEVDGGGIVEPK